MIRRTMLKLCGAGLVLPFLGLKEPDCSVVTWHGKTGDCCFSNPKNWKDGIMPGKRTHTYIFDDVKSPVISFHTAGNSKGSGAIGLLSGDL